MIFAISKVNFMEEGVRYERNNSANEEDDKYIQKLFWGIWWENAWQTNLWIKVIWKYVSEMCALTRVMLRRCAVLTTHWSCNKVKGVCVCYKKALQEMGSIVLFISIFGRFMSCPLYFRNLPHPQNQYGHLPPPLIDPSILVTILTEIPWHVYVLGRSEWHTEFWWEILEENTPYGRPRCRWENIWVALKELRFGCSEWGKSRGQWTR